MSDRMSQSAFEENMLNGLAAGARPRPTRAAWVCPKCGRVYGPDHPQCWPCNDEIARRQAILKDHKL
jgi:rubrerythrin